MDFTLALSGHPSSFGVSAAAARKDEDTSICPVQGIPIVLELTLSLRMVQSLTILLKRPIRGVFVNVRPMETIPAVRRVTEVVNTVEFSL